MLRKKVSADQITEQYDGAMLFALSSNYINLIDKSVCVCKISRGLYPEGGWSFWSKIFMKNILDLCPK